MTGLLMMVWLGCRCAEPPPPEPGPISTGSEVADDAVRALVASAEADGWTVQRGRLASIPLDECCSWESCYARNPSSHYAMYQLPRAADEAERTVDAQGQSFQFRMAPGEAIVFVGRTPPEAAYFSFRSYAHETWDEASQAMEIAFASLGDSLNHQVIGTLDDSPDAPFGATTVVMSVSDAAVERAVRARLVAAGLPDTALNVDVVPPERVTLGLGPRDDTLRMNLRVALFADEAAGRDYLADPPGEVLRLTPPTPLGPPEPLPVPVYRAAGGGPDELALQPAVDALREAVKAKWSDRYDFREAEVNHHQPPSEGPCWPGCNQDSTYAGTKRFFLPFLEREVHAVVYGVNHEATGMARYANVILMGADNNDPAGFVDSRQMPGTARDYLPDHPDADKLYAWRFSRDCGGDPHCSEVSVDCPGLEPREQGRIQWRTYLDPRTSTHVDSADMVLDGALLFVEKPL